MSAVLTAANIIINITLLSSYWDEVLNYITLVTLLLLLHRDHYAIFNLVKVIFQLVWNNKNSPTILWLHNLQLLIDYTGPSYPVSPSHHESCTVGNLINVDFILFLS